MSPSCCCLLWELLCLYAVQGDSAYFSKGSRWQWSPCMLCCCCISARHCATTQIEAEDLDSNAGPRCLGWKEPSSLLPSPRSPPHSARNTHSAQHDARRSRGGINFWLLATPSPGPEQQMRIETGMIFQRGGLRGRWLSRLGMRLMCITTRKSYLAAKMPPSGLAVGDRQTCDTLAYPTPSAGRNEIVLRYFQR